MIDFTNETKQTNVTDAWDEFISGNFIKTDNVTSENDAFICVNVSFAIDERSEDKERRVRLSLERDGGKWDMDLNKTNASKCKELGIKAPKDLTGKKIYFKKVLVRNPKINKEVESLRIYKIE